MDRNTPAYNEVKATRTKLGIAMIVCTECMYF